MTTTLGEYPGCREIFFTSAVGGRLSVLAENNVQTGKAFLEAMGKNPFTSAVGDRLSVLAENNLQTGKVFSEAMGKNPFTSAVGDQLSVLAENNLQTGKVFSEISSKYLLLRRSAVNRQDSKKHVPVAKYFPARSITAKKAGCRFPTADR